ncbi:MAG: choice-of-anchor J domain-containing protein [Bacteroidota bacterium]
MRKFILTPLIAILLSFGLTFNLTAQDLMITGVADGPLSGGTPKAIELYVVNDIPDLSDYGIDIAANGAASSGSPSIILPAEAATAGDFFYLSGTEQEFLDFFGFSPDLTSGSVSFNGDDAIELYQNGAVVDVFGEVGVDGTGETWDYLDGWGYRIDDATPAATFNDADWTFSGTNQLENGTTNETCDSPFPIGTFTMGGGCSPITTFPFEEGFEDVAMPDCWTILNEDGDSKEWDIYDSDANTGSQCAAVGYNASGNNDWLISPQISVSSDNLFVEFAAKSGSSTFLEDYNVLVSTTGTAPADFTTVLENVTSAPNSWEPKSYKLSDFGITSGTDIYVAIQCVSVDELRLQVDDFTIRETSTETDILTYSFPEETGAATIDDVNHTIDVEVGNGTDLTALVADFTLSTGATATVAGTTQESGVTANDFTSPVTYTVTAEDGTTTQDWVVTVTEATANTETDILTYSFPEETGAATIDDVNHTVDIEVAWDADITDLVADFTLSFGAFAEVGGVEQESGVTSNDFTSPVTYTITAEDGTTTQDWVVTVTQAPMPDGVDCANPMAITLPADLPYTDAGQSTCGMADDYNATSMGLYDGGEDFIYEITVASDVAVNITLTPTQTYSGVGLFEGCPDGDVMIDYSSNSSDTDHGLTDIILTAGTTYYIMVDSWPSPDCIDFDLTIEETCIAPSGVTADNLTESSALVSWTAGGLETDWNLEVSTTSIDPATETGDVFSGTVSTTPEEALSGLTAETDYYVYVQADCGSDWTAEYMFTTPAACPVVTGLTTTAIGTDVATLDWDALGTSEWNIKISDVSIDPETEAGNIEEVSATTSKPYTTTTALTPNTTYYFYVQATCGADWSAEGMFTTDCATVATFPFEEGFEDAWAGTPEAPQCWTAVNGIDGSYWEQSSTQVLNGDYSARTYNGFSSDNQADEWLITPALDLDAMTNPLLDFNGLSSNTPEGVNADMHIMILDAVYTDTTSLHANATEIDVVSFTEDWENYTLDLSAYSGVKYIAFHYYVTEADGASYNYMYIDDVSVREVSSETDFLTYSFAEQTGAAVIDDVNHTIDVEVGNGTDLTALVADFTISTAATATVAGTTQESGVTANDFTSPVTYTVTAEDGTTQDWVVTVTEAPILSETDIIDYSFPEETGAATIDDVNHTVDIEVAWNADITDLVAEYELSYGATAAVNDSTQESGVTSNDFTSPVTYTITAEDGTTTQDWVVTVTQGPAPLGANCNNPYTLELPAALTYEHLTQTTCGLGNVYEDTDMGNYDGGEDAVYEITVTSDVVVDITLDPLTTTYSGIGLFESCPDNNVLVVEDGSYSSDPKVLEGVLLSAGTYYIMIDTWPSPDCIPEYDLTIEQACPAPTGVEATDLTAETATISWMTGGLETDWNLKVSTTSIDPTVDAGDVFDGIVNTTPEEALTGLTAETDYYVYVQADCGSDWTAEYMFTTPAACPVITGLTTTAIGTDVATLDWDALGSTEWNIKISDVSIDPSTETGNIEEVTATTSKPYTTTTALTPNTTYYFYVQATCGADWSAEGMFTTECDVYTAPYTEDFENGGNIPDCWSQGASNVEVWDFTDDATGEHIGDGGTIIGSTNSGGYMAWVDDSSPHEVGTELLSPMIDISGLTTPELSFYLISNNEGDSNVDFSVDVYDGAAWNNDVFFSDTNTVNGGWEYFTVDLSTLTVTGPIQLRFVVDENNGTDFDDDVAIDDVKVDEAPSCPSPTNLNISSTTSTSASIGWTENGSAASWTIVYGDPGFDPETEGTTITADSNPYTLTGLTSATAYEAYVLADCGGELSDWTGPVSFMTDLCSVDDQCEFAFDLYDSYGDGWNGASIGIMQGGIEVATIEMTGGETDTVFNALCDGFVTDLVWYGGTYDDEISFTVYDPFGGEILNIDQADTITEGSVFFSFTSSCAEPITDLALVEPTSGIDCELTDSEVVPVQFDNVGETTIASGEIVNFTITSEGTPMIDEDITLSEDLLPGESWSGTTSSTVDLSAIGTYNWTAAITYAADMNADNDTIEGYIVNFGQEIQFPDAVNDTIFVTEFPYTIQPDVVYTPDSASLSPEYLWGSGETLSMLQVNEEGWYSLTVTTEGCSVEDSVFIRLDVGIDDFNTDALAVYPNPNDGQFTVDMTLNERQDVVLTVISSHGQVVRELKFDDVDQINEAINISDMAEGLYNLQITAGDKQFNRKITVR